MSNEESQDVKSLLLVINEKDRIIGNLKESLETATHEMWKCSSDVEYYKKLVVNSQVETYNELEKKHTELTREYGTLERYKRRPLVEFSGMMEPLFAVWAFAATTLLVIVLVIV